MLCLSKKRVSRVGGAKVRDGKEQKERKGWASRIRTSARIECKSSTSGRVEGCLITSGVPSSPPERTRLGKSASA